MDAIKEEIKEMNRSFKQLLTKIELKSTSSGILND